jgi:drug/metabolite transporter (DMT)-like permease
MKEWRVVTAFAAIYIIWGSTYLGILWAIETIPVFSMAGIRFAVAGLVLYVWARLHGEKRPSLLHWKGAAIVGGFLLLGGNGGLVWAEQWVPTGMASILISTTPIWMVLLDWARPGGKRPSSWVFLGLALGFCGVVFLIGPVGGKVHYAGSIVILLSAISWATGSLYSRHAKLPSSPLLTTGMEMLSGGVMLIVVGALSGEWKNFELENVSLVSLLSLCYLIIFGSIVAFTAYIWLLRVSTVARISTYAYVNPVVAIFLGWALAGEILTIQSLVSAAVIVVGVILIISNQIPRRALEKRKIKISDEEEFRP